MHEISMVEDVLRIILGVATENNIRCIDNVNLVIGEYMQVKPDLVVFAFDAAKEGTIASNAKLRLEIEPVEICCESCGNMFVLRKNKYECPICSSSQLEIIKGKYMYIKSIEGT